MGGVGGRMIAFAKLLTERHPRMWERIEEALVGQGIGYTLIEGCKDIWVRDFMPLRLKDGKFLSYEYAPNYLSSYPNLRTQCPRGDVELGLVLDGGNFVRFGKRAMMCEKIFSENPSLSRDEIISRVKERAGIEELIILPKVAYDRYGHSDGMARWISGDEILINDFSNESEKFLASLSQALRGYRARSLKYSEEFWKQYNWGAYLNFVEIENILLLPTYGIPEDKRVIERFEEIFENKLVIPIECKEIIKRGGALHCVSAEVKGVTQPVIKAL